jgi:hypothetical protein
MLEQQRAEYMRDLRLAKNFQTFMGKTPTREVRMYHHLEMSL